MKILWIDICAIQINKIIIIIIIAPAGFWPRGQDPRRHPRVSCMYTYKEFQESVGSMRSFLDLMTLDAHGGLG